jgi:hypothetical protein
MKQEIKQGMTDYSVSIFIRDEAGAPLTGLVFDSAGADASYVRVEIDNDFVVAASGGLVDLATPQLDDPHLDWGFLEVDDTAHPGIYRLDLPDVVFAVGAWSVTVTVIADGADPTQMEFVLVPELPYVGVAATQAEADIAALYDYNPEVDEVDIGLTWQESQAYAYAVMFGEAEGGGLAFKDPSGTHVRVTAAADASANRPAPTLIPTGLPTK